MFLEQRCSFVPDQISDGRIAVRVNLSVKLEIVLGGINVVGEEIVNLNEHTDNKLTVALEEFCQTFANISIKIVLLYKRRKIRNRKNIAQWESARQNLDLPKI